ncbi:MAG: hypothetical protein RLY70_1997 [Planctomycetota bacterium]|jgi:hypothetical protein
MLGCQSNRDAEIAFSGPAWVKWIATSRLSTSQLGLSHGPSPVLWQPAEQALLDHAGNRAGRPTGELQSVEEEVLRAVWEGFKWLLCPVWNNPTNSKPMVGAFPLPFMVASQSSCWRC